MSLIEWERFWGRGDKGVVGELQGWGEGRAISLIQGGEDAEREGFEPPVPERTTVFKTVAIDRSATSPKANIIPQGSLPEREGRRREESGCPKKSVSFLTTRESRFVYNRRMKIAVAMSGGVDSSYAAWKLREEGHHVEGFTFVAYEGSDTGPACRAAEYLGIPHHVVDLKGAFEERVITPFVDLYLKGYTPNPCVLCNRFIKGGVFLRTLLDDLGFEALATGHYARKIRRAGGWTLGEPEDQGKSQSYFLSLMEPKALERILFPLEGIRKGDVKRIMDSLLPGLFRRERESFEICFVKEAKYYTFLRRRLGKRGDPGEFVDREGNVLGRHTGFFKYTLGQRRGLGISLGEHRSYVVDLDPQTGRVVLGREEDLFTESFPVGPINWLVSPPAEGLEVMTRYRGERVPVRSLENREGRLWVHLQRPAKLVAPGQLAAFLEGGEFVGGGLVSRKVEDVPSFGIEYKP